LRTEDYHIAKKVLGGSFGGKRPVGRPHSRWEDNVQKDAVSLLHILTWKMAAKNIESWRKNFGDALTRIWNKAP